MSLAGQQKLALFDIGNTNITCGIAEGKIISRKKKFPTAITADAMELRKTLATEFAGITEALICSVTPKAADNLEAVIAEYKTVRLRKVGRDLNVPLRLDLLNPHTVGQDRLVCAWEAHRRLGDCLVVDSGTAITIDAVTSQGVFLGGIIAPGMKMCASALHEHTAQLPVIEVSKPQRALGKETREALLSGVVFGSAEMVGGLLRRLRQELGAPWPVIATGGDAALLSQMVDEIQQVDENLLLNGLLNLYYECERP